MGLQVRGEAPKSQGVRHKEGNEQTCYHQDPQSAEGGLGQAVEQKGAQHQDSHDHGGPLDAHEQEVCHHEVAS